jgi:hypothetical protein
MIGRIAGLRVALAVGVAVAWTGSALVQSTDTGGATVVVSPQLTVTVPSVAELRLDAAEIEFDLGGALQSATLACVYGSEGFEPSAGVDTREPVFPLGTAFRRGAYPTITVEGSGPVFSYPPLRFDAAGEALPGSDRDFVCYRSFLLRRFSNLPGWELSVERPATDAVTGGLERLYVRDGGCDGDGELQGLFRLDPGGRQVLASSDTAATCPNGDVVVLALEVGAVRAGETPAHLVYTLMAPLFETSP